MGLFADWNGDAVPVDSHQDLDRLRSNVGTMLGGIPNKYDILPSALCICLYVLLLVPAFWRLKRKELNGHQVWRPLLVIFSRIVSFGLRIKLSEGHDWDKDVFIAQLVLLRISPILLASALLSLFQDAIYPYLPRKESPPRDRKFKWLLQHFVHLLQIGCYFAFGVTIAIAFDVRSALHGSMEARQKLHQSKEMLIYTLLAINVFLYALNIVPLVLLKQGRYEPRLANVPQKEFAKFVCLMSLNTFLLVNSVFKTVQLLSPQMKMQTMLTINQKSLFWGICIAGEFIACALFVIIPWNRIVPLRELLEANLASMPPLHPSFPPPSSENPGQPPRHGASADVHAFYSSDTSSTSGEEEKECKHVAGGASSNSAGQHCSEFSSINLGDPFEPLPPPGHNQFPIINHNGVISTANGGSGGDQGARPPYYSQSPPQLTSASAPPNSATATTTTNRSSSLTLSTISEVGYNPTLSGSPARARAALSAGYPGGCGAAGGRPWSAATTASPVRRPTSTVDSLQSSICSYWSDDSSDEKDDTGGKRGGLGGLFTKKRRSASFGAVEKEKDKDKGRIMRRRS